MTTQVRVLVADDSAAVRALLSGVLSADPRIAIVGEACDGVEAVEEAVRLRPDVICMDVRMPRRDGLGATSAIMREAPCRIVVVSALADEDQTLSASAMGAGALELIAKPSSGDAATARAWAERVRDTVLLMSEVPVVRRWGARGPARSPRLPAGRQIAAIGIAASTGGPPALAEILGGVTADLPVPIVVAQHMTPGFVGGLARWLDSVTTASVLVARQDDALYPGHVYLAPDTMDLVVDAEGILQVVPSRGAPCPSGDRLLSSLAEAYGSRALGVVLTGMGEDGARGARAIEAAGGVIAVQDQASSVVYGMPGAAARACATAHVLPIEHVAAFITSSSTSSGSARSGPGRDLLP